MTKAKKAETITVCHPGSSDELTFKLDLNYHLIHGGDNESWIAEWDGWESHEPSYTAREGYYRVWEKKGDGWDVQRPDHPILGNVVSRWRYKTRAYAMAACAEDFVQVARLHRWQEHMKTHEPPS